MPSTLNPRKCHVCAAHDEHCEMHHVPLCGKCCATASPPWRGAAYRGSILCNPLLGHFDYIRRYVRFTGACIVHDAETYEYPMLVCVETFEKFIRPRAGEFAWEITGVTNGRS